MGAQINTRNIILDILTEVLDRGQYSGKVLSMALSKYQYITKEDRAFISRVSMGTIERLISIDYIADSFSKVKTSKMKPIIRNIIRMGIYQIVFMDRTDDYAACNEAVKLAAKRGFASLKGFVNGVLRTVSREKDKIVYPSKAVLYSVPDWLFDMWNGIYGGDITDRILASQYIDRPLTIRCNERKCSVKELLENLREDGVTATVCSDVPGALMLEKMDYLGAIDSFCRGEFWVQDLSSMLAAVAADAKEGDKVLDVCSVPGGKSLCVAMNDRTGEIICCDISDNKTALIDENIERLGIDNMSSMVWDATVHNPEWESAFDLVIADVPCSGLGILSKKPDIKYNTDETAISQLSGLQKQILANAASYVKKGGVLMYSTCTLNPRENLDNVHWLLDNYDFELKDFSDKVPENIYNNTSKDGYLEILPGINSDYDGFFMAKLVRK